MLSRYPLAVLVLTVLVPVKLRAECVIVTAADLMKIPMYELVFSGTIVEIMRTAELGYRATFDVDRVWKGNVPHLFDLYVWELAPEIPRFEMGKQYVAVAQRLVDPKYRESVGLTNLQIEAFRPVMCTDPPTLARAIR